jgi:hypothetical protein
MYAPIIQIGVILVRAGFRYLAIPTKYYNDWGIKSNG